MNNSLYNFTIRDVNTSMFEKEVIITQERLINIPSMILIIGLFIFLAYWYVKVNKNKEHYKNWTNPNGNKVNLFKLIRIIFWSYVGIIIVLGTISILLTPSIM